jgi:hypothetical protein
MGRLTDILIGLMLIVTVGSAILFALPFILVAGIYGIIYIAVRWLLDFISEHLIK